MAPHLVVAVEGPCCAGKTTLSRGLLARLADLGVAHVPCYADHVGGGRHLPPAVPATLTEDAAGITDLIRIEHDRTRAALASANRVILADRSLHTLLAHRCGIEQVTGLACREPAGRLLAVAPLNSWPNLVLYLDVPQQAVHDRNNGKFPTNSILIDPTYNTAFRSYFDRLTTQPPPPTVVWLDATRHPTTLLNTADTQIRKLLPHHEEDWHQC